MPDKTRRQIVLDTIATHSGKSLPIDYLPSCQADSSLRSFYGFPKGHAGEIMLLDKLGSDLYYLSARDISQREGYHKCWKKKPNMNDAERTCSFGIRWKRGVYDAKFSVDESIDNPLEGCESEKEILDYNWPKPEDFDFSVLLPELEDIKGRAVVGGLWTGILGDAYRLVGFQNFLLNIALEPQLIHTLINKLTDVYLSLNDSYFSALKGKMDIWFFGNDFGSQSSMLMSHDMWYEFFFEPICKLCALAHSYGLKVMMHSCGSIVPIIGDLINAGVDVLDPIQVSAAGMDPKCLADKFGEKITFHGGIDTQMVLPFCTESEVETHTRDIVDKLSAHGGFIASGSQIYGPDIPPENIISVYNTLNKINKERTSGCAELLNKSH